MSDLEPYPIQRPEKPVYAKAQKCEHDMLEFRQFVIADGTIKYLYECQRCGSRRHPMLGLRRAMLQWGKTETECRAAKHVAEDGEIEDDRAEFIYKQNAFLSREHNAQWLEWYDGYLSSWQWDAREKAVMNRDGHLCQYCGQKASAVHHLTYEHVGFEPLEDLVAICESCHVEEHAGKRIVLG